MYPINLCFCVVLYNRNISDSETIQSLLYYSKILSHLDIVLYIHNNEHILFNIELPVNIKLEKRECVNNASLSSIYNNAIREVHAQYTCLLDQDSNLMEDYFIAIKKFIEQKEDLLLPIVYGNGKIHCPRIYRNDLAHGEIITTKNKTNSSNFVRSIGSGIVLSLSIANLLNNKFSSVFDERFYIYKSDTIFFYRLKNLPDFTITIDGHMHQRMAASNRESKKAKTFRKIDTAAGWALQEKFYLRISFFYFFLKAFNLYIFGGMKLRLFFISLKVFYNGKHI
jgi:hypothetical protein